MIDRREILAIAANLGLLPHVVEKDYVLGWMLAGIAQHKALAPNWIFKGGTCLKKCYVETWRFSEDLDFTITEAVHVDVGFLAAAFGDIAAWIYDQTGIELPREKFRFEIWTNKRGRPTGQGRVSYRGPIAPAHGDLPRIKLDLTLDELLVLPPAMRRVSHPYSDEPDGGIATGCYAYEEAFAEKMRALGERARPRDLYDVVTLFRHDALRPQAGTILDVLRRKCAFKGIPKPSVTALAAARPEMEADWRGMLRHQLPSLPPIDAFWNELPALFAWIDSGQAPPAPPVLPLASGETVIRSRAGGLSVPGMATTLPIEIIRFAAFNRLTVELDYVDAQGNRDTREIEAYSLRRTPADEVVLHAVRADNGQHFSCRIDRIGSARATHRTFAPRYVVELMPSGALDAPMTAMR